MAAKAALGAELLNKGEGWWIVSPKGHWALMEKRRCALMVRRCALAAPALALGTLGWTAVDAMVFGLTECFGLLAFLRLLACGAFGAAGWMAYKKASEGSGDYKAAFGLVFGLALICFAFHVLAQGAFAYCAAAYGIAQEGKWVSLARRGYEFLPIVMAAAPGLFPLTVAESSAAGVLALGALAAGALAGQGFGEGLAANAWLCALVVSVSIFSGASQLSFLIEMSRAAFRDALTGAYGRRSGEELLDLHWHLAQRQKLPLSVAFFDLDKFKSINDGYGHEAGDKALREAYESLVNGLRKTDVIARWGGEEFVAILPNATMEQCLGALGRFLPQGLGARPDGARLTASVGVAEMVCDGCESWQKMVELADKRMYGAKQAGRDRVASR